MTRIPVFAILVIAFLGLPFAPFWHLSEDIDVVALLRAFVPATAFVTALYAAFSKDSRVRPNGEGILISVVLSAFGDLLATLALASKSLELGVGAQNLGPKCVTYFASLSIELKLIASIYLLAAFVKTYSTYYNLRTDKMLRYFGPIRDLRNRFGKPKHYEHNAPDHQLSPGSIPGLADDLSEADYSCLKKGGTISLFCDSPVTSLEFVIPIIKERLLSNETATIVVADRHPREFAERLALELDATDTHSRVVFVDAFTKSFGFTDEIHQSSLMDLPNKFQFSCVTVRTFAGIHTGLAKAFNIIKKRQPSDPAPKRTPQVNLFVGLSTLIDFESEEQFRVFWRHVVPSERAYKMLTFIVEHQCVPNDYKDVLRQLSTVRYDVSASIPVGSSGSYRVKRERVSDD